MPGGAINIHASNQSSSMKTEAEVTLKADQMDMLDQNSDDENMLNVEPEDIHSPKKIILQRQFYEAIVWAAAVAYENDISLPKLSDKLDFVMKNHLLPFAQKNKSKSAEDEVSQYHVRNTLNFQKRFMKCTETTLKNCSRILQHEKQSQPQDSLKFTLIKQLQLTT